MSNHQHASHWVFLVSCSAHIAIVFQDGVECSTTETGWTIRRWWFR